MGERIDRINLLYTGRDEPRYPGFTTPPVASPIQIQRPPRQTSVPIASPTLSTTSTASTQSRRTGSRRESSASSASSVSNTPPWHPQTLNQYLAMTPYNYGYDLPCEFAFLGCNLRFHPEEFEAWISHSASHFVGVSPPSYTICTFCDSSTGCFRSQGDPHSNWRRRMIHIGSHFQNLEGERGLRPDFWVIQYMWSNGLLSEDDFAIAMGYSERPRCDGIVPYGQETPEMSIKKEKESWQPYNLDKEQRQRKRNNGNRTGAHKSSRK
jgi:hypothetical protein